MRLSLFATLLLVSTASAHGSPPAKPLVTPFFSAVADGPAFFVECVNESGTQLPSNASRHWVAALRVDGRIVEDPGSIGGGLSMPVPAGKTWRGIVVLRRSNAGTFPAPKFGALSRVSRVISLSDGPHRFAFQCGQTWSDEVPFFWEG